ncbi:antitoxin [Labrys okinawensis]|uniref:antitoxin n=1 Tax=Labrys okinawensis TaxID=346911 RepID=UPI0039BCE65B
MSHYAKVFRSGNSQAVRLPKEFRFDVDEVEITREGDAIILRPRAGDRKPWGSLLAALELGFSDDFLAEGRQQPAPQEHPGLDDFFK